MTRKEINIIKIIEVTKNDKQYFLSNKNVAIFFAVIHYMVATMFNYNNIEAKY